MPIQPYLFFDGRCEEAIDFYKRAVGAEVNMMMRFNQSPEPHAPGMVPPGGENKIMHARMTIGDSVVLMADGRCTGKPAFQGMALTLTTGSEAEAEKFFAALSGGGKVTMPLGQTFFSPKFGMLTDKFGVMWMVYVGQ